MIYNEYQAKYMAYLLTGRKAGGVERLSNVLLDAKVDLNPHQVNAAVSVLRNPFSKGFMLTDEVGLGKTIEAGLVMAQFFAEGKKKILVIVPATLKTQWANELEDKFYLPCKILNEKIEEFNNEVIFICSYNYAFNNEKQLMNIALDLVVFDEAHKLRNVYKEDNLIANSLKRTFRNCFKLFLTATPLQNSLLELYGLASFIDDNIFGDIESFKSNYVYNNDKKALNELSERIKNISTRTLRRQVIEYIKYTNRFPLTFDFEPTQEQQALYSHLTEYLSKDCYALKNVPKSLIALMLLKQLASSGAALISTLKKMKNSLISALSRKSAVVLNYSLNDEIDEDEDKKIISSKYDVKEEDLGKIRDEIEQLDFLITQAESIKESSKSKALLKGLSSGFDKLKELGAAQKTVIFTESLKTQEELFKLLNNKFKKDEVILINGSCKNRDEIIKLFEQKGKILIATEVGSEGLNLQFCSMVINYDLPWNPQRIEQRIGRCHRYGQKYDVVVINFLNKNNLAENRVYELLSQKFCLFEGVFGASDTVLGVLENIDFEKRIADIYAYCRTDKEITKAFDDLRTELDEKIKAQLNDAKKLIFDTFDDDVINRLKIDGQAATNFINKQEKILWELTKYYLKGKVTFFEDKQPYSFMFHKHTAIAGHYNNRLIYSLNKNAPLGEHYRLNCALANHIIFDLQYNQAKHSASITYNLKDNPKSSTLESLKSKYGYLALYNYNAYGINEHSELLFAGKTHDGIILTQEQCEKLLLLKHSNIRDSYAEFDDKGKAILIDEVVNEDETKDMDRLVGKLLPSIKEKLEQKNLKLFDERISTLDKWADDKKKILERKIKEIESKIAEQKALSKKQSVLAEKLKILESIKALEQEANKKRMDIYLKQEEIDKEKTQMIEREKSRMEMTYKCSLVFIIKWRIE